MGEWVQWNTLIGDFGLLETKHQVKKMTTLIISLIRDTTRMIGTETAHNSLQIWYVFTSF